MWNIPHLVGQLQSIYATDEESLHKFVRPNSMVYEALYSSKNGKQLVS